MTDKLERKSLEELIQALYQEEIDINELNISKAKQREAFWAVIEKRPALLAKVKAENAEHLLKFALEKNPFLFVYLARTQYTDAFAQIFLYGRLTEETRAGKRRAEAKSDLKTVVQKSFDDKIVLSYAYATPDGEEVCYFDKDLQLPLSFKASAKISLKIVDAIKFIEKMDTHVTQLGEVKIKTAMLDLINSRFMAYMTEYVAKKVEGYYALCASVRDVEEGFVNETKKIFAAYGVEISEFIIKQFAIPQDVRNKIEGLAFDLRQRKVQIQADAELARISLESYEAKLAIESKYPDAETSLTEYEKDLALKRYLKKIGVKEKSEVNLSVDIAQTALDTDGAIEKSTDVAPEINPKKNKFRIGFILLAVLCGIWCFTMLFMNLSAGLILTGVCLGVFGVVAAFCEDKLKDEKVELDATPFDSETPNDTPNNEA